MPFSPHKRSMLRPLTTQQYARHGLLLVTWFFCLLCYCHRSAQAQYGGPFGVDPDRPYDQNAFWATHDSYATLADNYDPNLANHHGSFYTQLELGVRAFTLRCYLMWQWTDSNSIGHFVYPDYTTDDAGKPLYGKWHYADTITKIAQSQSGKPFTGTHQPNIYLAHGPDMGYLATPYAWNTLSSALAQIKLWVDRHPDQVVSINLDMRNTSQRPEHVMAVLVDSGLSPLMFFGDRSNTGHYSFVRANNDNVAPDTQPAFSATNLPAFNAPDRTPWNVKRHGWPTLRQLIDGNGPSSRRVVITNDNDVGGNGAYHGFLLEERVWQNGQQDGPAIDWASPLYQTSVTANFISFGPDYSGPTSPFLSELETGYEKATGPIDFNLINGGEFLGRKLEIARNHNHRLPSRLSTDAAGKGDPGSQVFHLNELWEKQAAGRMTPFHYGLDRVNLAGTGFHPTRSLVHQNRLFAAAWGSVYKFNFGGRTLSKNQLESTLRIQNWSTSNVRLAAVGNYLFAGVAGNVYALDINHDLNIVWKQVLSSASENTNLLVTPGPNEKLFAAHNGLVYELDIYSGHVLHQNNLTGSGNHEVRLASNNGNLYVGTNGRVYLLSRNNIERGGTPVLLLDQSGHVNENPVTLLIGSQWIDGPFGRPISNLSVWAGCGGLIYQLSPLFDGVTHRTFLTGSDEVSLAQPVANGPVYAATQGNVYKLTSDSLLLQAQRRLPYTETPLTSLLGYKSRLFVGCHSQTAEVDTDDLTILHVNPLQDGSYRQDASYHGWGIHYLISRYGYLEYDDPSQVGLTATNFNGLDILISGANGYLFLNTLNDGKPLTTTVQVVPAPNTAGWNNQDPTKVALNIAITQQDYYKLSDTVFLQYSDRADPKIVRLPNATDTGVPYWNDSVNDFREGVTNITYYSVNQHGVQEAPRMAQVKIDSHPPITTATANAVDHTVLLTGQDNLSGIAKFVFWFDRQAPQEQSPSGNSLVLPIPIGARTLHFHAIDNAGNSEADQPLDVVRSGLTPKTTLSREYRSGAAGVPGLEDWYAADQVRLKTDWAGNPLTYYSIDEPFVYLNANSITPVNGHVGYAGGNGLTLTVPPGAHTLYYYTVDLNNGAAETVNARALKVDPTPPITNAVVLGRQVTLTASDAVSGIDGLFYSTDENQFGLYKYTKPFAVSPGKHAVYFYSRDLAQNQDEIHTIIVDTATDVSGQIKVGLGGLTRVPSTTNFLQKVTLTNTGNGTITGPLALVLDNLSDFVDLVNLTGRTSVNLPAGSPYVDISGSLAAGASVSVTLRFSNPRLVQIGYSTRVLAGTGTR